MKREIKIPYILIDDTGTVQNIAMFDNYEDANQVARACYGDNALAQEYRYAVSMGDIFRDGFFYNIDEDGNEELAEYIPSDEEQIRDLNYNVSTISQELYPTIDQENCTLEEAIDFTVARFGEQCTDAIYAGQNVETTRGTKHFSYTDADQRNLKAAADLAISTGMDIPYHADKEDCCLWPAADIVLVYGQNEYAKTYHTTYCNLLNGVVRSQADKESVFALTYGMELPEDKQTILNDNMTQARVVFEALKSKIV